jgi:putative membrane protein
MSPEFRAVFAEWTPPLLVTSALLLCAIVYTLGWFKIRQTRSALFPAWRQGCFLLGLAIIWLAIASPLDGFADALLMHWLRRLGRLLTTPVVAWLIMNLVFLGWHVPTAYDFALEHEHWHECEHICFLGASIVFWWPVVRPWPTSVRYPGWIMLPYLIGADVVNTALSAFLAFCDRPVYRYYLEQPNLFHIDPLTDQIVGAVIMWVVGSLVFLVPAVFVTVRLLQQDGVHRA